LVRKLDDVCFILNFILFVVEVCESLEVGSTGNVVAVKDPSTGRIFAIKSVPSASVDINVEIMLDRNLFNSFLLKYHGVFFEEGLTHILTEFCEKGDLFYHVKSEKNDIGENVFSIFNFVLGVGMFENVWASGDGCFSSAQTQNLAPVY
jgi:serine/threonine protein kinase